MNGAGNMSARCERNTARAGSGLRDDVNNLDLVQKLHCNNLDYVQEAWDEEEGL